MLDINKIYLNYKNTRFALLRSYIKQDEAWKFFLLRSKDKREVFQLFQDILLNGLRLRHFILFKIREDQYITLEGNRRIFVLKFLFLESFRHKIKEQDSVFYDRLIDCFKEYSSEKIAVIKQAYQDSSYQTEPDKEAALITLARIHNNKKVDGKTMRPWNTWETNIDEKKPEAVFVYQKFLKLGLTAFLETIDKNPKFRYTIARDMLNTREKRTWFKVTKNESEEIVSYDEEYTEKKLISVLFYVLNNPDTKVNNFFYSTEVSNKTFNEIEKTMKQHSYNYHVILKQLKNQNDALISQQSLKIEKNLRKLTAQKPNNTWFSSVNDFEEKMKSSKLYELVSAINKMKQKDLKKYQLLVFISLRSIIEFSCKEFFYQTQKVYFNNTMPSNKKNYQFFLETKKLSGKVLGMINKMKKACYFQNINLNTLEKVKDRFIQELNEGLHDHQDTLITLDRLKNNIKLIDDFLRSTLIAINKSSE